MERNTWLAMTLCFLIFLGWEKFVIEPQMQKQKVAAVSQTTQTEVAPQKALDTPIKSVAPVGTVTTPKQVQLKTESIKSETGDAYVGNGQNFFNGWDLKTYHQGLSSDTPAVDLYSVTNEKGQLQLAFDDPKYAYLNEVIGNLTKTNSGAVWSYEDDNVKLTREIAQDDQDPYLSIKVHGVFKSKAPAYAFLYLNANVPENDPQAQDRHIIYWNDDKISRTTPKDVAKNLSKDPQSAAINSPVKYIGVTNHYFLMTAVSESPQGAEPNGLLQSLGPESARVSLVYPINKTDFSIPVRVYFGPKNLDLMRTVDPRLDHAVDFGMFTILAYPILKVLKWLYYPIKNYGIAIILLTLLLRAATYPLTYKSMKSMKEMQAIQPQLARLREKYKDDKVALNQEMLTLMRSHGYNPMAGCLPMLIQIPIFFALYQVLRNSIELYHAPFAFWIRDLSSQDPYFVTPILLTLTMFFQQRLTPNTATDPAQARMMQMMPVIFGLMMIKLASGLTLYMLISTAAGIVQQLILNKKLNIQHAPVLATRTR